jgi:hypothetical protein
MDVLRGGLRRTAMRLVRGAAAAAVGIAVLAGCSDGGTANETLPPTSTTAAETSESLPPLGPADFPVPDEARNKTQAGAAAFAQYYIELSNFLLPSLESSPLRELSLDCDVCTQLADGYDADRTAGYTYSGGELTIRSAGKATLVGDAAEIAFIVDQAAVGVADSSGTAVPGKSSDAYALTGGVSLQWENRRKTWLVAQLTLERQ